MNLALILKALELAGTATPAFIHLFETVKESFGEQDRAKLEAAYAASVARADAAHEAAQGL